MFVLFPQISSAQENLGNVHARVYSTTAAELFFEPASGLLTSISRNGSPLGNIAARSLFLDDFDPDQHYRFELTPVDADGRVAGDRVALEFSTGSFASSVEVIWPLNSVGESAVQIVNTEVVELSVQPSTEGVVVEPDVAEPESAFGTGAASIVENAAFSADTQPQTASSGTANSINPVLEGCRVFELADLRNCLASREPVISLVSDLSCSGGDCCRGRPATVNVAGLSGVRVEGNGFTLKRSSGQRDCPLLEVRGSRSVEFSNLTLDDDAAVDGCQVENRCPHMIHVIDSNDIAFRSAVVENSKGYAVYVNRTDGFEFTDGRVAGSGVLGMYIGHSDTPSRNITITGSTFVGNQTNGLALLGVVGDIGSNVVSGNTFSRNHWQGQWQVEPQFGSGFTGGGQVYLAQVDGLLFSGNRIMNGYCSNCFVQRVARSGVTGLEFGLPGRTSVANVRVEDNTIANLDAWGIGANQTTRLGGNVVLSNNRIVNTQIGVFGPGLSASGNQVSELADFSSFESSNGLLERQQWSAQCGRVERVCNNTSLFGSCMLQLQPANDRSSCDRQSSAFFSPEFAVNGDRVYLSGWARTRGARICLESLGGVSALDGGSDFQTCETVSDTSQSTLLQFEGWPAIAARVPSGVARVAVYPSAGNTVDIDDLKLSFGR